MNYKKDEAIRFNNNIKEKSFFRRMIEEKDLINEIITVETDELFIIMEVEQLVSYIEQTTPKEQAVIKDTFSKIDFHNGDLMHYLRYLTECMEKERIRS